LIAALALAIAGAAWWAMYARPRAHSSVSVVLPTPTAPVAVSSGVGAPITDAGTSGQLAPPDVKSEALPGRRKLQLTFNGECWAEIYDARGMRLFFGFGHTGTTQELSGVAPFRLVLGNGPAVALALEGTAVSLPPGLPGQRVRILVGANGAATAMP
jgi:cytoskeleton protein RodZ